MWIYVVLFLLSVILYLGSSKQRKCSAKVLFALLLLMALFVGLGDMLGGYDRYIYTELFDRVADVTHAGGDYRSTSLFKLFFKEFGYGYWNVLVSLLTRNRYIFILLTTLLVYALVFVSMMKYTNRSPLAVVLFMGLWFFFTFTYLRQVMAASICWLAIEYAIDRKPWFFFPIVILAFFFHNSAIVFLPIYFVPIVKYNSKAVLVVMVICLGIGLSNVPSGLFNQYGEVVDVEQRVANYVSDSSGFRYAYLLEALVFLVLILLKYDEFDENNKTQLMLLNMSFVFCGILLIFIRSENGGRLSWFYIMGLIATLNYLATHRQSVSGYSAVLIAMCAILFLRILLSWGMFLYPYKTFLTPGYREGDQMHAKYEYDSNYDTDKLYR